MPFEQLKVGLPLIRIPLEGANAADIEKEQEQLDIYEHLALSAIAEVIKLYTQGVLAIIANHNESVPITKTANRHSFIGTIQGIYEEIELAMNDLNADVKWDLEKAIEEENDDAI